MNITITLGDLQDLNAIKGMLESFDEETSKLGYSMLKTNPIFAIFQQMVFMPKPGKEIPVMWYVRKADEIMSTESNVCGNWRGLILPILDAIISGSNQFKTSVYIHFNKSLDKTEKKLDNFDFEF